MASGMGMPSIGIYSHELFHFYDVDNIIRVGSAGAISPQLKVRDVVFGQGSCTDSNYAHQFGLGGTFAPIADFTLLETAVAVARKLGIEPHVGSLLSSDVFYNKAGNTLDWGKMGVLAVEMESAAFTATRRRPASGSGRLHRFGQPADRRGPLHHRAPDLLHPDDHPRPGGGRGHGRPARVNGRGKSRPSGRLFPRETIREDITPVGHVPR